jgi:hypothetical protein
MNRIILAVVFAVACVSFTTSSRADVSEATFTPQGSDVYPPIPVSEVQVFVYKPDFKFKIIGIIEARGMAGGGGSLLDSLDITKLFDSPPGEKEDIALAMKALKEEAANAGANGVLIIRTGQVRVSQDATERQIKAAAIRRIP